MSRHRNIRSMNVEEECDDEYDVYGRSLEDYEYGVSPGTMAEYTYDRSRSNNPFLNLSTLQEEEGNDANDDRGYPNHNNASKVGADDDTKRGADNDYGGGDDDDDYGGGDDDDDVERIKAGLSGVDLARLSTCMDTVRGLVDPSTTTETTLLRAAIHHSFQPDATLNSLFDGAAYKATKKAETKPLSPPQPSSSQPSSQPSSSSSSSQPSSSSSSSSQQRQDLNKHNNNTIIPVKIVFKHTASSNKRVEDRIENKSSSSPPQSSSSPPQSSSSPPQSSSSPPKSSPSFKKLPSSSVPTTKPSSSSAPPASSSAPPPPSTSAAQPPSSSSPPPPPSSAAQPASSSAAQPASSSAAQASSSVAQPSSSSAAQASSSAAPSSSKKQAKYEMKRLKHELEDFGMAPLDTQTNNQSYTDTQTLTNSQIPTQTHTNSQTPTQTHTNSQTPTQTHTNSQTPTQTHTNTEGSGDIEDNFFSVGLPRVASRSRMERLDVVKEYEKRKQAGKEFVNVVVIGHVDAGKSTLMGRLLYEEGMVEKKMMRKFEQESRKIGKSSFAYAWVLDETQEERSRGVTMDIAQRRFETTSKVLTLIDAPGHKDFIPNMITGAAQADVAILVVNASRGEFETGFELGGQTREHAMLARSLGVNQVLVAVNKMDTVDWSQERFNQIVSKLSPFLKQMGFKDADLTYIPCSGLAGDNLTTPSIHQALQWYTGPTLVQQIDKFRPPIRAALDKVFRMSVTDVFKGIGSGTSVGGVIYAGNVQSGDRVLVAPVNQVAVVKNVSIDDGVVGVAYAGDNVVVIVNGVDSNKISIGNILSDLSSPVQQSNLFRARIVLFNTPTPITKGYQVVLHQHSSTEQACITRLVSILHRSTGQVIKLKPRCLTKNSSAIVDIRTEKVVCVELFSQSKEMGRFMLRSSGLTVAAGVVLEVLRNSQASNGNTEDGN